MDAVATQKGSEAAQTLIVSAIMFGISMVVSVAFAYFLFANPSALTGLWATIRALPMIVQLVLWLIFLPWMLALWVLNMPWAFAIKAVIALTLIAFAEYLLFPWK